MLNLIAAVNPLTILYSTLVLLVLALVFGVTLAVLGKKLAVHEDERIKQVREKLSGANCGGCGYAGCDAFAKRWSRVRRISTLARRLLRKTKRLSRILWGRASTPKKP